MDYLEDERFDIEILKFFEKSKVFAILKSVYSG